MKYFSREEIKEKADIISIMNSYLTKPLTKAGSSYKGFCPFHDDKNHPSMSVWPSSKTFHCFSCEENGDVFSFVSKISGVSYNEAVKIVANKCGMDYEYTNKDDNKFKEEYEIMDYSLKFYQNNLVTSEGVKAVNYLNNRGITDEIIKNFHFGLSFNDNGLKKFLESKNINLDLATDLGLLSKNGINYYDMFQDRIMIPIFNNDGKLCGYTGRCYLKDEDSKYINTKKTSIYDKSEIIFNFYNAKKSVKNKNSLIIVEGNMDAISLASKGITNVCALMGVAMSPSQINTIKRLNTKVILMLDSDDAGEKNTERVGDELYKNGIDLKTIRLKNAKDPDEYINKFGIDALLNVIDKPINYLDYKLNKLKNSYDLNSIEDKTKYINAVKEFLKYAPLITREIVFSSISNEYNIPINLLAGNEKRVINKPVSTLVNNKEKVLHNNKYEKAVNELIYAMLKNKNYYGIYMSKLGYLKNKIERDVVTSIGGYIKKYGDINIDGFLDYIIDYDEILAYVHNIISNNNKEKVEDFEFYDILDTAIKCVTDEEIKEVMLNIKNETDENNKIKLIERLTELKKGSGKNE